MGILVPWYIVHQTMRLHPECQIIKRRLITKKKDSGSSILCNSFKHKIAFVHCGSDNTQEWMCLWKSSPPPAATRLMNLKYWHSCDFTQSLMSSVGQSDRKGTETGMPAADGALAQHCTLDAACFKSISKFIVRMQHRCSRWQQTFDQKSQTQT
jgi:hypothetical protein